MSISDVYAKIKEQLDEQLPFVVYRKSDSLELNVFLQENDNKYMVEDYDISGFVFAPFDSDEPILLIPSEHSKKLTASLSDELESNDKNSSHKHRTSSENLKDKETHKRLIEEGIQAIASGNFKKVVLSRKEETSQFEFLNPLLLFQRLLHNYPTAFVYYWYHPKVGVWLGATPETLLHSKNNEILTMSLAGTQPYQEDTPVTWGSKEIDEQGIVTQYILKKLDPVLSSITASKAYTYRAGSLLHLRTDIKGTLNSEVQSVEDIIKILHPTPAVCGLPKEETQSFIRQYEGYDRKFYTGFLGELNMSNGAEIESNLFVNLRCMEVKGNTAILYVGGGITKDSIPEKEWEETVKKTETMRKVLF